MRIKMLKDKTVDIDVNNKRTFPKGLVFNLSEELASQIVADDDAEFVNADDAEKSAKAKDEAASEDGLDGKSKKQLEEIAAERGVDISDAKNNDERVALIRATDKAAD